MSEDRFEYIRQALRRKEMPAAALKLSARPPLLTHEGLLDNAVVLDLLPGQGQRPQVHGVKQGPQINLRPL